MKRLVHEHEHQFEHELLKHKNLKIIAKHDRHDMKQHHQYLISKSIE